jgi:sugar (pentulose or hexulose) kinase
MKVDDAQPVQEVLAELTGGNEVVQVAIGGGDHANVETRR